MAKAIEREDNVKNEVPGQNDEDWSEAGVSSQYDRSGHAGTDTHGQAYAG